MSVKVTAIDTYTSKVLGHSNLKEFSMLNVVNLLISKLDNLHEVPLSALLNYEVSSPNIKMLSVTPFEESKIPSYDGHIQVKDNTITSINFTDMHITIVSREKLLDFDREAIKEHITNIFTLVHSTDTSKIN